MTLEPGSLLAWLLVGAIAGWLAGQITSGGGFGILGDVVVGLIGAFVGGWLFSAFAVGTPTGFLGSIVVAVIGAVIFVGLLRLIGGGRRSFL
jgi:uncharacterized membrane protein YeaQ/YmgE (transglycosylase-associated protein family)